MKVKIIRLSKKDAHYSDRDKLIGLIGELKHDYSSEYQWHGFSGIAFIPDEGNPFHFPIIHFAYVKFEQVNDE